MILNKKISCFVQNQRAGPCLNDHPDPRTSAAQGAARLSGSHVEIVVQALPFHLRVPDVP